MFSAGREAEVAHGGAGSCMLNNDRCRAEHFCCCGTANGKHEWNAKPPQTRKKKKISVALGAGLSNRAVDSMHPRARGWALNAEPFLDTGSRFRSFFRPLSASRLPPPRLPESGFLHKPHRFLHEFLRLLAHKPVATGEVHRAKCGEIFWEILAQVSILHKSRL